jgi:TolB-like protein
MLVLRSVLVLFCLLFLAGQAAAAAAAHRRLAVLEFSGRNLDGDVLAAFSDAVRGGALEGLSGRDIKVMTRESMLVMLREMGKSECVEGDCEVETARNIGADFVISGIVVRMDDSYVVTLKLHETKEGALLATETMSTVRQIEMLNQLRVRGRALVAALATGGPVTSSKPIANEPNATRATEPAKARPAGTVYADLRSTDSNERWDVYTDDEAICSTPCTRWLDPTRELVLRSRGGFLGMGKDTVRRDSIGNAGDATGAVLIKASPTSRGEQAGGIVMTVFGGMATAAGAALLSVGYATDGHDSFRTGGYASGISGLVLLGGGIWLILDSRARMAVEPMPMPASARRSGVRVIPGPGFVVGSF